tara:strand:- start:429 stop:1199 length:771 start_codon:yes stop_codon:yes gene_type:complete
MIFAGFAIFGNGFNLKSAGRAHIYSPSPPMFSRRNAFGNRLVPICGIQANSAYPPGNDDDFEKRKSFFSKSQTRFIRRHIPEGSIAKLNQWKEKLEEAPSYYSVAARDAIYTGELYLKSPPLILKNFTQELYIVEWEHKVLARNSDLFCEVFSEDDDSIDQRPRKLLTSHMMIGVYSGTRNTFFIYGIIENPENTIHEFSILTMIHNFKIVMKNYRNSKVNIDNLKHFCHGVHHFSLTHPSIQGTGIPAVNKSNPY